MLLCSSMTFLIGQRRERGRNTRHSNSNPNII